MKDMISFVEPLIPALRRYAWSFMKDRAAGEDLVQDTLERAISRCHQRRPDGSVRSWLFTILHNLAINRLREQSRGGQHISFEEAAQGSLAVAGSQEDSLHRRDIAVALDALPEEQRAVLLLISVEDLSYAETARVLDVPIGTVMSRLSRGRERLLKIMESDRIATPVLRRVK